MENNEKPLDLGDPSQAKEAKRRAESRDKRINNGLALVLSHPDSRLWLFSMLEDAGPFQDAFATNAALTSYRCGQQAWAKRVTAIMLEQHLDLYTRMMKENNQT